MKGFEERGSDMSWREFERHCEDLVKGCFSKKEYRVQFNVPKKYADGTTKRMDIHVAERRRGGRHFVIDCKHFPKAHLNENEIQTTLDYKRKSKASKAIILVSEASNCPDSFKRSAKDQGYTS